MAWSDLPVDLLHRIASQFNVLDLFRFSIACTYWYSALAKNAQIRIRCLPSPWLIIPSAAGEASHTLTFRDFTTQEDGVIRHHRLSSLGSDIFDRRYVGSNNGWLVCLDNANLQPILLNPLTMAERSLPSLLTIPEHEWCWIETFSERDGSLIEESWDKSCHKIVVSSNDPLGTAVVIYRSRGNLLAFARPDEEVWTLIPPIPPPASCERWYNIEDVWYHEEDRMFYAITTSSAVLRFDLNGENAIVICAEEREWRRRRLARFSEARYYIIFLSGTLLRIERIIAFFTEDIGKTSMISVSKLVSPASRSFSKWTSVNDLGGFSIFIGCNNTFSLQPLDAPGIKPNCIYFSDDWEFFNPEKCIRDAGLYDLHTKKFEYFRNYDPFNWPTSIWFSPSLT